MTPKDKLVVVQDLEGYLVAEQGECPAHLQKRMIRMPSGNLSTMQK